MLSPISMMSLFVATIALWAILQTTNPLLTIVALGAIIVCCLVTYSFSPLPVQLLIVAVVMGIDKLQSVIKG